MNLAEDPVVPMWKVYTWVSFLMLVSGRIIFLSLRDHLFIKIKPKTYLPEESKVLK